MKQIFGVACFLLAFAFGLVVAKDQRDRAFDEQQARIKAQKDEAEGAIIKIDGRNDKEEPAPIWRIRD